MPEPTPFVVDEARVTRAAQRLLSAVDRHAPVAPVRDLIGGQDIRAAYRVQQQVIAAGVASGRHIVGRKIGATSEAVQTQLGVDQPDFGVLFGDMAYADGQSVPFERLLQPKVEAEVAFVLGRDLSEGDLDLEQCREAVDYAVAALEIVDSRIADWDITFGDTVADNASSGLYVLGARRRSLAAFEPRDVEMSMTVDGQVVSTGTGAACLGDPLNALSWLALRAREFGEPLRAGQVVLSGSLGPMHAVGPGSTVTASITGLGTVTTHIRSSGQETTRQENVS